MWEVVITRAIDDKGLIVMVTDGKIRSLIGRVAWSGFNSTHPNLLPFRTRLRRVMARADAEVEDRNAGVVRDMVCPYCGEYTVDVEGEVKHMQEAHPEIIKERLDKAGM